MPVGIAGLQALLNSGGLKLDASGDRPMAKLSDYVKTADAAEILGVAQNTLRAWAEAGKIPVHRNPANGYRLFLKADLEKFLRKVSASGTKRPSRKKV